MKFTPLLCGVLTVIGLVIPGPLSAEDYIFNYDFGEFCG